MRIYRNDIWRRIGGALLGLALAAFGIFGLLQSPLAPSVELADRAWWWGFTLLLAGIASVLVSWLAPDLSNIWCRSPRFQDRK